MHTHQYELIASFGRNNTNLLKLFEREKAISEKILYVSVVCQEYHNSPPGCHRHICIVWKASVQCEGCSSRFYQLLSTHQNEDASDDAPSEDDAGITDSPNTAAASRDNQR